jgi:hypothetical protein
MRHYHRGSSLVYLGLSLILFVITYGLAFLIMPMIFGAFYEELDNQMSMVEDPEWLAIGVSVEDTVKYLVPLMPSLGIVIIVIKVIMTASARGRD